MALIEVSNKDKVIIPLRNATNINHQFDCDLICFVRFQHSIQKHIEKLEVQIHEYSIKIEELNRTIIDITSIKTRLSSVRIIHSLIIVFFFFGKDCN